MQLKDYSEQIKEIYFAGLLHDTGKYIHKYNGRKIKHWIASQMFILENPVICGGLNSDKIANIVSKHHEGNDIPDKGVVISPSQCVTNKLLKDATDNYNINSYWSEIDIIKQADVLSASSDRASEINNNAKGTSAPYAPLISPIGKFFDKRIAVKHKSTYEVYEYIGEDDRKDTIESQDKDFTIHIENSFKSFMEKIKNISSVNDLDKVLKEYWSTVNANTWRPHGENLCNTTTSLYDHSKTTAAIAVCIYINRLYKYSESEIDIIHISYNGINIHINDKMKEVLAKYEIQSPNIICSTDNEAYIMIPSSITEGILKDIESINADSYSEYAETLDYEIAKKWQFKNCRLTFNERISHKHFGIMDVILKIEPKMSDDIKEYQHKEFQNKVIAGYNVNGYKDIINRMISENDSISKISTTFRVFEQFNDDVQELLKNNKCTIIESNLSSLIYATDLDNVHKLEKEIHDIYKKYVSNLIGLYFTYMEYDRYIDTIQHVKNEIETKQNNTNINDEKVSNTTILLQNKRYMIQTLLTYENFVTTMSSIEKSLLQRVLDLYEDLLQFNDDNDAIHLISRSRMNYMLNQTDKENINQINFINNAYNTMYNSEKNIVPSKAFVFYIALKTALKEKR